jgi:MSHA biogenesis protein MshO
VIATGIPTCAGLFRYGAASTRRSGLVLISLQLRVDTADRPVIRLVHQVHVDNTP